MRADSDEKLPDDVPPQADTDETKLLVAAFSRVRPFALGVSVAVVAGLALFAATALLLLLAVGQPEGYPIGTHLGRLSNVLPGYDVTWPGAFLGLLYGAVVGFVGGALLGWLLNLSHAVYVRMVLRRMREGVIDGAL